MENIFQRKYALAIQILSDVAQCANQRLVLVGGTALAFFYLKHRVSVDLDFIPLSGDDAEAKEALKGCMSKKGYRTQRARYSNQFIVQSENSSVKVEVFTPDEKVQKIEKHKIGAVDISVASLDDLLRMKSLAYSQRKKARDLFDVVAILLETKREMSMAKDLVEKYGIPPDADELEQMFPEEKALGEFKKVIKK